jgi:hypothetical protein
MTEYSKGEHAYFICDRSGAKYPYKEGVKEPGTGLFVHYSWSDGRWNAVTHPLNKPPAPRQEQKPLRFARPGDTESRLAFLTDEQGHILTTEEGYPIILEDGNG